MPGSFRPVSRPCRPVAVRPGPVRSSLRHPVDRRDPGPASGSRIRRASLDRCADRARRSIRPRYQRSRPASIQTTRRRSARRASIAISRPIRTVRPVSTGNGRCASPAALPIAISAVDDLPRRRRRVVLGYNHRRRRRFSRTSAADWVYSGSSVSAASSTVLFPPCAHILSTVIRSRCPWRGLAS